MKVIVYPHSLGIGGSQINAVDCAAAVRDTGHDVAVFGTPGPLVDRIKALGLPFVAAPIPRRRPDLRVMRALLALARDQRADLVHAYEWPPALEAYYGPRLQAGIPVLFTIMSMAVAPFLPGSMPLVVGTRQVERRTAARHRGPVALLEPPVDTVGDHPGVDPAGFRRDHGLRAGERVVVIVSRLAVELKLEGLERSIAAVGRLARDRPVRLVIVGDGEAAGRLAGLAAEVNDRLGHRAVVLTGALLDPRPAYAAADVVVGMGGSILRGLAFGKPAVVLGERGFSEVLTPASIDRFMWQGFYGVGDGDLRPDRLCKQLAGLLADEALLRELGRFSREVVCSRYSLQAAGQRLDALYQAAVDVPVSSPRLAGEAVVDGAWVAAYKAWRRLRRLRGAVATDDFNARAAAR